MVLYILGGDNMEDAQIVDLYWERNEYALIKTSEKYGKLCFSVAFNILNNHEDSEECVNDTYLEAWEAMPPHRPNFLSAFLAKITRNNAIIRIRFLNRKKRKSIQTDILLSELDECLPSDKSAEDKFDETYVAEIISKYLYSVSQNKAAIFVFRYFFCYSIEDLSAKTGYSQNKITSMLFRMRNELKNQLEKGGINI